MSNYKIGDIVQDKATKIKLKVIDVTDCGKEYTVENKVGSLFTMYRYYFKENLEPVDSTCLGYSPSISRLKKELQRKKIIFDLKCTKPGIYYNIELLF